MSFQSLKHSLYCDDFVINIFRDAIADTWALENNSVLKEKFQDLTIRVKDMITWFSYRDFCY